MHTDVLPPMLAADSVVQALPPLPAMRLAPAAAKALLPPPVRPRAAHKPRFGIRPMDAQQAPAWQRQRQPLQDGDRADLGGGLEDDIVDDDCDTGFGQADAGRTPAAPAAAAAVPAPAPQLHRPILGRRLRQLGTTVKLRPGALYQGVRVPGAGPDGGASAEDARLQDVIEEAQPDVGRPALARGSGEELSGDGSSGSEPGDGDLSMPLAAAAAAGQPRPALARPNIVARRSGRATAQLTGTRQLLDDDDDDAVIVDDDDDDNGLGAAPEEPKQAVAMTGTAARACAAAAAVAVPPAPLRAPRLQHGTMRIAPAADFYRARIQPDLPAAVLQVMAPATIIATASAGGKMRCTCSLGITIYPSCTCGKPMVYPSVRQICHSYFPMPS